MGQKKLTLGNAIAIVAIFLLCVFSFLGIWWREGNLMQAILISLGMAVLEGLILFTLVTAKQKDRGNRIWFPIEMVLVLAFFGVCCLDAKFGGTRSMWSYMIGRDQLSAAYTQDMQAVDSYVEAYHKELGNAFDNAQTQVAAYLKNPKKVTENKAGENIKEYVKQMGDGKNNLEAYYDGRVVEYSVTNDIAKHKSEKKIESFNLSMLGNIAKSVSGYGKAVKGFIDDKQAMNTLLNNAMEIPNIPEADKNGRYSYSEVYKFSCLGSAPVTNNLTTKMGELDNGVAGWIVFILLNALVFFNYLVTRRTISVGMIYTTIYKGNNYGRSL